MTQPITQEYLSLFKQGADMNHKFGTITTHEIANRLDAHDYMCHQVQRLFGQDVKFAFAKLLEEEYPGVMYWGLSPEAWADATTRAIGDAYHMCWGGYGFITTNLRRAFINKLFARPNRTLVYLIDQGAKQ